MPQYDVPHDVDEIRPVMSSTERGWLYTILLIVFTFSFNIASWNDTTIIILLSFLSSMVGVAIRGSTTSAALREVALHMGNQVWVAYTALLFTIFVPDNSAGYTIARTLTTWFTSDVVLASILSSYLLFRTTISTTTIERHPRLQAWTRRGDLAVFLAIPIFIASKKLPTFNPEAISEVLLKVVYALIWLVSSIWDCICGLVAAAYSAPSAAYGIITTTISSNFQSTLSALAEFSEYFQAKASAALNGGSALSDTITTATTTNFNNAVSGLAGFLQRSYTWADTGLNTVLAALYAVISWIWTNSGNAISAALTLNHNIHAYLYDYAWRLASYLWRTGGEWAQAGISGLTFLFKRSWTNSGNAISAAVTFNHNIHAYLYGYAWRLGPYLRQRGGEWTQAEISGWIFRSKSSWTSIPRVWYALPAPTKVGVWRPDFSYLRWKEFIGILAISYQATILLIGTFVYLWATFFTVGPLCTLLFLPFWLQKEDFRTDLSPEVPCSFIVCVCLLITLLWVYLLWKKPLQPVKSTTYANPPETVAESLRALITAALIGLWSMTFFLWWLPAGIKYCIQAIASVPAGKAVRFIASWLTRRKDLSLSALTKSRTSFWTDVTGRYIKFSETCSWVTDRAIWLGDCFAGARIIVGFAKIADPRRQRHPGRGMLQLLGSAIYYTQCLCFKALCIKRKEEEEEGYFIAPPPPAPPAPVPTLPPIATSPVVHTPYQLPYVAAHPPHNREEWATDTYQNYVRFVERTRWGSAPPPRFEEYLQFAIVTPIWSRPNPSKYFSRGFQFA